MCGRTAQTHYAVRAAESLLRGRNDNHSAQDNREEGEAEDHSSSRHDNYNVSPGMDVHVFWRDGNDGSLRMDRKVWGLVPKPGTTKAPLPSGMSKHFSNLMFNARSDTLLDKRTFRGLFDKRQTCVVAVDGFFEWRPAALKGDKKQPYYVFSKSTTRDDSNKDTKRPFLLLAGLWTSVPTGRTDEPSLDTFTILTTDSCPCLTWLHSRMPVCLWDVSLAHAWLERPCRDVLRQLEEGARQSSPRQLQWHAVTTRMNVTSYRSPESIKPLPPPNTVKSFFAKSDKSSKTTTTTAESPRKNAAPSQTTANLARMGPSSPSKTQLSSKRSAAPTTATSPKRNKVATPVKKGSITSFFSPKSK